jgi:hypothetical protein
LDIVQLILGFVFEGQKPLVLSSGLVKFFSIISSLFVSVFFERIYEVFVDCVDLLNGNVLLVQVVQKPFKLAVFLLDVLLGRIVRRVLLVSIAKLHRGVQYVLEDQLESLFQVWVLVDLFVADKLLF